MDAVVSGYLYIPLEAISSVASLKADLTVRPVALNPEKEVPAPIRCYDESREGYLGVPLDYGFRRFGDLGFVEELASGHPIQVPRLPDPDHPQAPKEQKAFMASMLEEMQRNYMLLAKAGTGTGKTVSALNAVGRIGRSAFVVVPSETIMHQWVAEVEKHLGVPRERIGIVQQNTCEWDRDIVVCLVHSIVKNPEKYPRELFTHHGIGIWDEAHRYGAETFSRSLALFNPEYRMTMTATDNRKDGTWRIVTDQFGPVLCEATGAELPIKIIPLQHRSEVVENEQSRAVQIAQVARDAERNEKILKLVATLYDRGRFILVIGDNTAHLQNLRKDLLERYGVPEEETGLFVRSRYKPNKKGRYSTQCKKAAVKNDELDRIKQDDSICVIFATYGSMREAVDIPRLDAGVDVTPRSEGRQVIGRIRRRLKEGSKPTPEWYTPDDVNVKRFHRYFKERLRDYKRSANIEVVSHGQGS